MCYFAWSMNMRSAPVKKLVALFLKKISPPTLCFCCRHKRAHGVGQTGPTWQNMNLQIHFFFQIMFTLRPLVSSFSFPVFLPLCGASLHFAGCLFQIVFSSIYTCASRPSTHVCHAATNDTTQSLNIALKTKTGAQRCPNKLLLTCLEELGGFKAH